MSILCKKCESDKYVKSGFNKFGNQRYRCKICGCHFIEGDGRVNPDCEKGISSIAL